MWYPQLFLRVIMGHVQVVLLLTEMAISININKSVSPSGNGGNNNFQIFIKKFVVVGQNLWKYVLFWFWNYIISSWNYTCFTHCGNNRQHCSAAATITREWTCTQSSYSSEKLTEITDTFFNHLSGLLKRSKSFRICSLPFMPSVSVYAWVC